MNTTCFKAAKLPCCSGSEVPHLARMHLLAYHGEGSVGAGYLDGAGLGAVFTGHLGSVGAGIHWSSGQCWGRYLLVIWAVLGQVFTGHLGSVGAGVHWSSGQCWGSVHWSYGQCWAWSSVHWSSGQCWSRVHWSYGQCWTWSSVHWSFVQWWTWSSVQWSSEQCWTLGSICWRGGQSFCCALFIAWTGWPGQLFQGGCRSMWGEVGGDVSRATSTFSCLWQSQGFDDGLVNIMIMMISWRWDPNCGYVCS